MKLSYAITVCNELEEIQRLVPYLMNKIKNSDEIVILFDQTNGTPEVERYLDSLYNVKVEKAPFENHFGDWKNLLTSFCGGDYIVQVDADEKPSETFLLNIHDILKMNVDIDVVLVPRVNIVLGLTDEHVAKWKWNVNEKNWVNWPDPQFRVYRNEPHIKWVNKVHERLEGYNRISNLPFIEDFAFYHIKEIERQEKQNSYYDTL